MDDSARTSNEVSGSPASDAVPTAPDAGPGRLEAIADALLAAESAPTRRPVSTYRLQLHAGFTIEDLTGVVPYLAALGITDLYLSPHLQARPGSTHGYDVFDHTRLNAEIGSEAQYARLTALLTERGMGRVLDIVPNHMGVGGFNRFWTDVLELGPHAHSARFFDIDWSPVKEELAGRVLLPILEDQYGVVLENGLLRLARDEGDLVLEYHDTRLPLSPRSYALVLGARPEVLTERFDADDPEVMEYRSILDAARSLPLPIEMARFPAERSRRERDVIKRRIRRLCAVRQDLREFLDANVAAFAGQPGDPRSFDAMHGLLEQQVYRLAYWRVAGEEINYRRFFDINDLAGLRTEDPLVFDAIHTLIFQWVAQGGIAGLRIDHPDGLADPLGYATRLQERLLAEACRRRFETEGGNPDDWPAIERRILERFRQSLERDTEAPTARRFPIVVEKILSGGERLPDDWPIDGTVGYEFLNLLNGLFVDPAAAASIDLTYRAFTGDREPFPEVVYRAKGLIARSSLASEINTLARRLNRISEQDRRSRDFTLNEFRLAIREVIACFPVYRTYLRPGQPVTDRDRRYIAAAVRQARRRNPHLDPSLFAYLQAILLLEAPADPSPETRSARDTFVLKFQQTTGPIQAKGLEDTAFYRQVPLASLNEVGGEPTRFGVTVAAFHQACADRLEHWPNAYNTTSTHDTKRGEDARVRIDALTERPAEWRAALERWSQLNARFKRQADGSTNPDVREEHLLYQILVATWPFGDLPAEGDPEYTARIQQFLAKAAREAKLNTSWTDPDPGYVEALGRFAAAILEGPEASGFRADFAEFHRQIATIAVGHSLAQTLIKHTAPGVPDLYQGCELWDFSLVDPDNRRPVDFALRTQLLERIDHRLEGGESRLNLTRSLIDAPGDGAIKLYLTRILLEDRRTHPELYSRGAYRPLTVEGPGAEHLVAFARSWEGESRLILAPRLLGSLPGGDGRRPGVGPTAWGTTRLPLPDAEGPRPTRYRDLLTGQVHPVADPDARSVEVGGWLDPLPIAILAGESGDPAS